MKSRPKIAGEKERELISDLTRLGPERLRPCAPVLLLSILCPLQSAVSIIILLIVACGVDSTSFIDGHIEVHRT